MNHKILVVGDFYFDMYEEAFYQEFLKLYPLTDKFRIADYLDIRKRGLPGFIDRFQYKFNIGLSVSRLNAAIMRKIEMFKPDLVFVYRGKHIFPKLLKNIKDIFPEIKLFNYNNDDAFSKAYPFYFWRLFLKGITYYDHIFCYRSKNIEDLRRIGYTATSLLLPYYIEGRNFEINCEKVIDVVFVGHFENDGRDEYIVHLINNDIKIKLFGTSWAKSKHYAYIQQKLGPIDRLDTLNYNLILNQSKIGLVFLSKINNDGYTRRCFEIPMTNCMMLAERTEDLSAIFKENGSISFFDNKEDMVLKIKWLLKNPAQMAEISYNAKVLVKDNFEVQNCIKKVVKVYLQTTKQNECSR